jgi:hypothetical protein
MRTILFLAIACAVLTSCQQPHGQQTAQFPDTTKTPYYYLLLKGTLGNEHITMQLTKSGPWMFRGYYTYDKVGEPILIWGSPDDEKVVLYENTEQDEQKFFTGKLDSTGSFKGIWRGNKTSYPFALQSDYRNATPLDVYYVADSLKLLPGNPNSPTGQATNNTVWPTASTDPATADFIRNSITGGKPIKDPVKYLRRDIDSFLATYKVTARDMDGIDTAAEGIPATASWSADADMKVVWNHYPLLVLEYFSFEYTGGAHGNYGAHYQVLDLQQKKILKVDDVLKPEYKTALVPELEKAFRKIYKVADNEKIEGMLLVKEIQPNDNFLLTDQGIAFSYTPYEIGAYAMGQVTLFIPFKNIKSLLK